MLIQHPSLQKMQDGCFFVPVDHTKKEETGK